MRYLLIPITALLLAVAAAAAAAPEPATTTTSQQAVPSTALSAPVFVVTGSGYGHGVGLSQYGALAQANAGRAYRDILAFYYPGTQLGKANLTRVRVLVADARPSVRLSSPVPFTVTDASGTSTPLDAGDLTLGPDLEVPVAGVPTALTAPLVFRPGNGSVLSVDGKGYRGQLRVTAGVRPNTVQVVAVVGLDQYLLGVVPGEMPKQWPAAALQAQAVAARSYALAGLVKNRDYDLYSDVRSQVYYGVGAESPATTAAVQATKGEILTFGGKVASTPYCSSSGGRTASSLDAFGFATPYLVSRDDPWDASSPYHRWVPRAYTAAALGAAFGLSAPIADVQVVQTPSGRPASVTLVKKTGQSILLRAADVRARLGLRSTAFRIGVLRVARPMPPVAPGEPVAISGLARDVAAPVLERLGAGGSWRTAARIVPDAAGGFRVTVRPATTSTYRVTADGQPGPVVTVSVPTAASAPASPPRP
jgi:stage II sporulation protein D